MNEKVLYIHYNANGVECCIVASSINQAAKAFGTYHQTIKSRSKVYSSPDQVPSELHQAMSIAVEQPGQIVHLEDGRWKRFSGNTDRLQSAKQLSMRGTKNAQIGEGKMNIRSVTCDDDTWSDFLALGGSKWFRKAVKAARKRQLSSESKAAQDS
ncbi:hypothetical protein EGJ86_19230 [Pseudomonas sp. o96-267]|uniref:hypothetical protein n=1 Tax=Pseudomonas sp. o96-267 TaxID=2479853 RepID=UPI000F79698E|nr:MULTISPECIES: hypothetical protein [Pseudomonas]MDH0959099.1 hypothetical protein [Pseudomonas chengduensis]MDV5863592.1 hypothetical protein [Pseudomonas mendocina]RRV31706.1 hypothetical protein EGJ86_19230 [Pseudomonas sp. o96-267]